MLFPLKTYTGVGALHMILCVLRSLLSVRFEQKMVLMQVAASGALLPGHGPCALPSCHWRAFCTFSHHRIRPMQLRTR